MNLTDDYQHLVWEMMHILHRYERILRRYEDAGDCLNERLPFPFPVIERKCAFAEQSRSDTTELITLPGQRTEGLKEIRDFTLNATSLLIIDPYLFSGRSSSAAKIAEDFIRCTRLDSNDLKLQKIHIVHGKNINNEVKAAITKSVFSASCEFTTAETNAFHDRVWIADNKRGLVVGTSLNGIGSRAAFLLPLPQTDLNVILDFLGEENLFNSES